MSILRTSVQSIIVISGILLIGGSMFDFGNKIQNWNTFRAVLMSVCAVGYITYLIYLYKSGNKEVFKESVIYGVLILIASLVFIFCSSTQP